jgi:hypothetical protein
MSELGGKWRKRTGLRWRTSGPNAKHLWPGLGAGWAVRVCWGVTSPVAEGCVCACFFSRRSSWSPRSEPGGRGRKRTGLRRGIGGLSVRHSLSELEVGWAVHVCWGVASPVAQGGVCSCLHTRWSWGDPLSELSGGRRKRTGLRWGRSGPNAKLSWPRLGVGWAVHVCWWVTSPVAEGCVCAWFLSRWSSWSPRSEPGGRGRKRIGLRRGRGGLSVRHSLSELEVGRVVQDCGCSELFVCMLAVCNKLCDRERS